MLETLGIFRVNLICMSLWVRATPDKFSITSSFDYDVLMFWAFGLARDNKNIKNMWKVLKNVWYLHIYCIIVITVAEIANDVLPLWVFNN